MSLIVMSVTLLIILINCSEVKLQHTSNPEIHFRSGEINGTDFIVEKNKPLDIVLDNYFAKYAWCLKFYYTGPDDVFIKHVSFNGSSDSVMGVPRVNDNMITDWWCVVLQEYKVGKPYSYLGHNYTAQNIVFNLHDDHPTFKLKLIYTISSIAVAALLIVVVTIITRIYCCKPSNHIPIPFKINIDPDSVFYVNLEIFRRQYERELQAQEEPVYEEID